MLWLVDLSIGVGGITSQTQKLHVPTEAKPFTPYTSRLQSDSVGGRANGNVECAGCATRPSAPVHSTPHRRPHSTVRPTVCPALPCGMAANLKDAIGPCLSPKCRVEVLCAHRRQARHAVQRELSSQVRLAVVGGLAGHHREWFGPEICALLERWIPAVVRDLHDRMQRDVNLGRG